MVKKAVGKMRLVWLWTVLFAINLFSHEVSADHIFPPHVGGTFSRSSREPKYKIEFHPEDSPFHPDGEVCGYAQKNGERFLCFLPKVEKSKSGKSVSQVNTSSLIVESEKQIKLKIPEKLLDGLQDRCFIRQEGWWTYEFCYHKKLGQNHLEDEKKSKNQMVHQDSQMEARCIPKWPIHAQWEQSYYIVDYIAWAGL